VLPHGLEVLVCDEEADVISLNGFPSHHHKLLRALHQETSELVAQNLLDLVLNGCEIIIITTYYHSEGDMMMMMMMMMKCIDDDDEMH
jgi:hypothetical protein